jgi:transcriptional regulator with XRE-family HTH domain
MDNDHRFTDLGSNRKAFGDRLRLAMKGRLTQEELAKATGASLSGVKKWLSGASDPGWSGIVAAAQVCGISLDWLATGKGQMRPGGAAAASTAPTATAETFAPATDARLMGRLTEKILLIYKEMGVSIAIHQATERAAKEHDRIVATVTDPDDRLTEVGEVTAALRQELRAAAADPASSKRRA